jgi:cellulose synthase/poly-beta-1,6-N-acetylglucosamine synthase-like glycosyltransferase
MEDIIMILGAYLLGVLFIFLLFVFVVSIASLFVRKKETSFEPPVSVIVPCYNEEKNIGECLDSLFNAAYPMEKLQVIVVDDGSTDNTMEILKGFKKHENFRIVKGKHKGKSEALNLGVKAAKHDFILTIDADTVIERTSIQKLVNPFIDERVGATNGSCIAKNTISFLTAFQNIEYHYNNLIRRGFSRIFKNGIWFFGAFACYRKKVLEEVGFFKKDTLTEDMDIALEIFTKGHKITNVDDAFGYTVVPDSILKLAKQRIRWWGGVLQSLWKNKKLFSHRSGPSIIFLFVNQYWWSFFALLSIPLIAYQFSYWLPSNMASAYQLFMYTFRWFSLLGPVYVFYMIPEWGISPYSIFGVMSGVISAILIVISIYLFKDRMHIRNIFAVFFYFPYTILLNSIISISLVITVFFKKQYFIS